MDIHKHMKENRDRAIKSAISSWTDKLNGVYRWYESKRYSKEYCMTQIEFFEKMKLCNDNQ